MDKKNNMSDAPFGMKLSHFLHHARITYHLRNPLLSILAKTGIFHLIKSFPNGMKLALNVDDAVQMTIYRRDSWEKEQVDLAQKLMRDGDVFVDIGAHCGSFAVPIAYEFKKSKVLAFEPNPRTYNLLVETKKMNSLENLLLDSRAISTHEEFTSFYVSSGATDSLAGLSPRERAHTQINVQTTTLEQSFKDYEISHIRIIKMDIEGAEGLILPANYELFTRGFVDAILLELHVDLIENFNQTAESIIELLKSAQFRLFHCKGFPVQPFPDDWKKLIEGSIPIQILGLRQDCLESGKFPKVW